MTYRAELTRRAERDLNRIYQQIDAAGSAHALAWFIALETAVLSLEENPTRCPFTPEDQKFRQLLHGHGRNIYRVIFRVDERRTLVMVRHVRHGARRPIEGP